MKKLIQSKFYFYYKGLLITILSILLFIPEISSATLTVKANHDHIKINFFYHGDEVNVSGISDEGLDLIIKITSPEIHQVMKKKGKVAGLLWMNVGTLNFEHVPNLYFLHTTGKLDELLEKKEMDRYIIGYPALFKHVEITSNEKTKTVALTGEEKEQWFKEYVKFKESLSLYHLSEGDVSIKKVEKGLQDYHIRIEWPYQAPPGEYTVTVYGIKNKQVVETAETKVFVEQVGGVKTLSDMAKNYSAIYGIISIIVAIAAGFGVGMIFRKGGSH